MCSSDLGRGAARRQPRALSAHHAPVGPGRRLLVAHGVRDAGTVGRQPVGSLRDRRSHARPPPRPGRLEFSIRLAIVCTLTLLIVQVYQTPEPALTAYVAFFVVKSDRTGSVVTSLAMVFIITFVIAVVFVIG